MADKAAASKPPTADSKVSADLQASINAALHPVATEQTFEALDIKRIVRTDGSWLHAVNGVFTPETQEDYDQLKYFEEKSLVKEVK